MKIMTFNTQHLADFYGSGKVDIQKYADYIKESGADVVGLNEIRSYSAARPEFENQTAILATLSDMPYCFFAQAIRNVPYGNAIVSKLCIKEVQNIEIPDPDPKMFDNPDYETRCILKAKLENGLTIMVSHFGLNPDEHENAAKTVMENLEDEKCILMGDFNVLPNSHILDPIRAKMKDTADLFTQPLLSFPADVPERKIDYIFATPDIEVVSADIPALVLSDHRPYIAEINF